MKKKINIKFNIYKALRQKGVSMGQNGVTGQKMLKIKKREQKRQKSLPKMADFCHFFPSNRRKWRDQAFIEGQTPPSPLLYHHLSQKENNILHAICVTDLGTTQNPEFPRTKSKAICGWGTFLSIFGSGQGIFYRGIRYFFPRILGIPKFTPAWKICLSFPNWTSRMSIIPDEHGVHRRTDRCGVLAIATWAAWFWAAQGRLLTKKKEERKGKKKKERRRKKKGKKEKRRKGRKFEADMGRLFCV